MPQFAQKLAQHHEACEKLIVAGEEALERSDWDAFIRHADGIRDALLLHFEFEEEEVFPAFERASGMRQFTQELCLQHREMRTILDTLVAVSPRHDPEGCSTEFATLALLFRQHRAREEQVMYPAFERTLAGREKAPAARSPAKRAVAAAELDVRALEPPEPMLRIMQRLTDAPDEPLRVRIHREPFPLYELLAKQGFRYRTRRLGEADYELLIERA